MYKFLLLSTAALFLFPDLSQAQDSLADARMDALIIYSSKFAERRKNIVQQIDVISAQRIAALNAQTTGDLLIHNGNVFVQKSQQGGGSPVLRGFEASRVLLVVDGIRMNNAIYRAGHLQSIITVDQNMLERVEVLYGPASTLYGSDALGGVVLMRTKNPTSSPTKGLHFTGTALARYSSANAEKTVHADASLGGRRWAWLQSYTFSDFGDTRIGSNGPAAYRDFGLRPFYVDRINGIDSVVANKDPRVQKFSGYRQWDVMQKLRYQPGANTSHQLNLQLSHSGDIPRYDRLQDLRNGQLRFAEWYYGPQIREMAAYEFNRTGSGFFSEVKAIIAYQHLEESRQQSDYRRYDRRDSRRENLEVGSFTIDGRRRWRQHELTVGVDGQLNFLTSEASRIHIDTGAEVPIDSRYPNGKNRMHYFGAYVQHLFKWGGGKWVLNDGIRFQAMRMFASIADNAFFNLPFTEIRQNNSAVTGNLGIIYMPSRMLRFNIGIASGFRAPNIDDLARIFESSTADSLLVVPNPAIGPEYTYTADAGITVTTGGLQAEAGLFYTWMRDAIALAPFTLNGADSIDYNGSRSAVYANQNINSAYLYGFQGSLALQWSAWKASGSVHYTYGRLQPGGEKTKLPLDHIPPVYGRLAVSRTADKWNAECYVLYNGWKRLKDYSAGGEDNAQYATPEGAPSWMTLNLKGSWQLTGHLQVQAGIENILDRNYRYFASGFSAPGRNFILAARAKW